MSLLLDALKRAEQEKSARGTPGGEAAVAPRAAGAATVSLELQPLAHATPANSPHAARGADALGAQALFDAKAAARPAEGRARGALLAAIGAIAVIVLAAGAYVWYSINALAPRATAAAAGAALQPPAAPTPPPASGVAAAAAAAPASSVAPAPTLAATPGVAPAAIVTPARSEGAGAALQRAQAQSSARTEPLVPEPRVQLSRTREAAAIPADVASGYDALRRGDLAEARRGYAAALAVDPANVDALLGLATLEGRSGRAAAAAAHYRRALQVDPHNATARAGLAALADWSRPEELETQIRADLARAPQSAALHAALGNLYASQARWTEAQSAYFEAHRLQPGSADTTYNLAVSLDHLGQPRLAREYYERAVEAARSQATQFDPAAAARRLAELR